MNSSLSGAFYSGEHSLPNTLKRTRSLETLPRKFNASRIPPLPRVNGDLALQVFTHKSLRRPNGSPADYGDNERLADLGRVMFDLAVTHTLFEHRPMLRASVLSVRCSLSFENGDDTQRI
jgi:dsRNA-specific ribonuclease